MQSVEFGKVQSQRPRSGKAGSSFLNELASSIHFTPHHLNAKRRLSLFYNGIYTFILREYTRFPNAKEEEESGEDVLEVDFPVYVSTSCHLNTHEIPPTENAQLQCSSFFPRIVCEEAGTQDITNDKTEDLTTDQNVDSEVSDS